MRVPFVLATLASWARPAASFASMPSGAKSADDYIEAIVELALTNCNATERARYARGVEVAAAAEVTKADDDSNGMITGCEYAVMKRDAEQAVGDVAHAVMATLKPNECVVDRIRKYLEEQETSATATGNGRMLEASRRRRGRLLSEEFSTNLMDPFQSGWAVIGILIVAIPLSAVPVCVQVSG